MPSNFKPRQQVVEEIEVVEFVLEWRVFANLQAAHLYYFMMHSMFLPSFTIINVSALLSVHSNARRFVAKARSMQTVY